MKQRLPIAPYAAELLAAARGLDRRFRVTSMYRSPAAQQRLYTAWLKRGQTGLPAAPPGHSMHELGEAVDLARGIDPFKDPALAQLGAWWRSNGLGWSEADPVHFQLQPIPQHAAGLASGERHTLRAPMPSGALDSPITHPASTRGLTADDPTDLPMLPGGENPSARRDAVSSARALDAILGYGKGAAGAALASFAAGGGVAGAAAAGEAALAAAPVAVPLATAGIIAGIMAEHWDDLVSGKIDPFFDATTAEAQARSRRQAALIRQDLSETGYKFARKTGVL